MIICVSLLYQTGLVFRRKEHYPFIPGCFIILIYFFIIIVLESITQSIFNLETPIQLSFTGPVTGSAAMTFGFDFPLASLFFFFIPFVR